ncbi:hypothetical protein DPEC_G00228340 [Dallia pectoralis]|uniref:Uncharacterized protein n=1 Tax=Dallia pectoralis TaxID=75939 RepID=A0ACC2G182_DALPE|nr:hypothetical protein DPEC_G00228340 [Dallia pectoralis]
MRACARGTALGPSGCNTTPCWLLCVTTLVSAHQRPEACLHPLLYLLYPLPVTARQSCLSLPHSLASFIRPCDGYLSLLLESAHLLPPPPSLPALMLIPFLVRRDSLTGRCSL